MKGMIFAAGLGTRLRPLTNTMPKALVPVGGVPMLQRVLCKLRDAGIGPIVVNVHHFAADVERFLKDNAFFGADVQLSPEFPEPFETGGAIKHAGKLLEGDRFLVHNVDILSNLDLHWLEAQDAPENLATLLVTVKDSDRYLLFDDDMRLAGWQNVKTGEVKSPYLPSFDPSAFHRFSFTGIHILSPEVLPLMASWPDRFSIIDFYLSLAASGRIKAVLAPSDFRLIDIGTPEALKEATKYC